MSQNNVKSMTGYGKAERQAEGKKISVEIRSLNSKQMDLSVRMPSVYREKEYELRNRLTKRLQRGKADVQVCVETVDGRRGVPINMPLFKGYYEQLSGLARELGVGETSDNLLTAILKLPEVMQAEKTEVDAAEWQALDEAVEEALDRLDAFRTQEGRVLIADMLQRVDRIEACKDQVVPYEKQRIEVIKARIRDNIRNMDIAVEQNRFEQELIFYVEKLDITEEKVRLQNHCDYFRQVSASEENPGRKLGFIAQEMGREINTLGSKANDTDIQRLVVRMKDELEKIKEQVLNLL